MITYQPEKLNWWDRIFNRYKTIPVEQGNERWISILRNAGYSRNYVIYHIIDRLTGGYTIKKEYLND